MITLGEWPKSALYLAMALISAGLASSCKCRSSDPKEELVRSLKGASVEGYEFEAKETDARRTAMLTNSDVRNLINLDSGAASVILRYTSLKDKNANTSRIYKTEVVKTGNSLTLQVTDLGTGEVVSRDTFPAPDSHNKTGAAGGPPAFNSLQDCINDFNCTRRGALQCEADRTCQDQFAALTCCLSNGQCFSVHLVIRPVSVRCALREAIPNLGGLVFSQ